MPLPGNGILSLQGYSRPGDTIHSKPKQAMIVRMSEETLELLEAFPNQPPMDFEFGTNPGIHIGDTFFQMRPLEERSPHELYLRTSSVAKPMAPLKLYASVTGKFTVERELGEKIQDKVRDRTLVAQKKRTERTAILLDTPPDLSTTNGKKRKAPPTMFRKPIQPTDRRRGDNASSAHTQPQPPPPSPIPKDGVIPVRKRLIHCLALSHRTADEVIRLVGGTDCDPSVRKKLLNLLGEVGEQIPPLKKGTEKSAKLWRPKTRSWLEVQPYEWPKLTETERTNMARLARLAYKDLNIPETDPVWNHVRYRSTTTNRPTTPNATPPSNDSVKTTKKVPPKRGMMSTEVKEKIAKTKGLKTEVLMKDESVKPLPRATNGSVAKSKKLDNSKGKGDTPPTRRLPGSGFKASKSSPQNPVGLIQPKDRELSAPSPSAKSTPPMYPPSDQDHKSTLSSGAHPSSVGRIKKTKGVPPNTESEEVRSKNLEGDKNQDRERTGHVERDRQRGQVNDTDDQLSANTKRKKPPPDDDSSKSGLHKKRKIQENGARVPSLSREPEQPPRDLSLPKKPTMPLPPRPKTTRDISPSRLARPPKRDTPPLTSRSKAKKDLSPPPRTSTASHPKTSSTSHNRPDYPADPAERSGKTKASLKPRRRSPIYTSSEDEAHPPKATKHNSSSTSRPTSHLLPRPSIPLTADHATLRARYDASYLDYITTFQKVVAQKRKIEALLKSRTGSVGSITDSDGDVELMDAEELTNLNTAHVALRDELESIRQMFLKSGNVSVDQQV